VAFVSSKRWTGAYFYCIIASTLGVLVYQLSIFLAAFAKHANMYGVVVGIGIGWTAMVLGQSLVLWSRLHIVCLHTWKIMLGLCLIVINGICVHALRIAVSLLVSILPQHKSHAKLLKGSEEQYHRYAPQVFQHVGQDLPFYLLVTGDPTGGDISRGDYSNPQSHADFRPRNL
jgi:hypothetical protein